MEGRVCRCDCVKNHGFQYRCYVMRSGRNSSILKRLATWTDVCVCVDKILSVIGFVLKVYLRPNLLHKETLV